MLTLEQLRDSLLVVGPGQSPHWDAAWRRRLVDNLEILVRQLWQVGVSEIFINGSFAEDKDHPNDIDGYFECELQQLASVELYPHFGQLSGIRDQYGHELEFPSAFRQTRHDGRPKGVVKIGASHDP